MDNRLKAAVLDRGASADRRHPDRRQRLAKAREPSFTTGGAWRVRSTPLGTAIARLDDGGRPGSTLRDAAGADAAGPHPARPS